MPPKSATPLAALLADCLARCVAIESALSSPPSAPAEPSEPLAPLADARNDFIALSNLLGKHSTELTLAMKPPVSLDAAESTLNKMKDELGKLTFCLEQLPLEGALTQEMHWIAIELSEALAALLKSSLALHQLPTSSASLKPAKAQRELNLRLTAQVWDAVKRCEGVSQDELSASRKGWQTVLGLLDDCLEEVKELEESTQEDEEGDDEDDDDDEDDSDLDEFRNEHPLSEDERQRVAAAHTIIRLARLLIFRLLTSTKPDTPQLSPTWSKTAFLGRVRKLTRQLSAGADDLAGTLEPPQDETDLEGMVGEFVKVARELSEVVGGAVGEEERGVGASAEGAKSEAEWQTTWRAQLDKAHEKLNELC